MATSSKSLPLGTVARPDENGVASRPAFDGSQFSESGRPGRSTSGSIYAMIWHRAERLVRQIPVILPAVAGLSLSPDPQYPHLSPH